MRRVVVAGVVVFFLAPVPAAGQELPRRVAIVVVIDGSSLQDLLAVPELRALATRGGAALMNGRTEVRDPLSSLSGSEEPALTEIGAVFKPFIYLDLGPSRPSEAVRELKTLPRSTDLTLMLVVSASPSAASAADGDELGAVITAWGDPDELLSATGASPRALTSDSTRRPGVVATVDPAATVAEWLDFPYEDGAPIERTGEPAPLDLYERYLQQRRVAVPIAAGAWGVVTVAGVAGVSVLLLRNRVSDRTLAAAGAVAASLPWLALALLLAGHLPSLTYVTVIPFLLILVVGGVTFTRWVAARRTVFVGLTACGSVILALLAVEAALGWPAAVTPLAGGGQLDGGRFFGMPNIEIGLVLGTALYVAHRMRVAPGAGLLVVCALVVGSPWTGANYGGAITLFAAAGLWLGLRRRRPWWATAVVAIVVSAAGMIAISLMHRYLAERPTHVTAFLEGTRSLPDAIERVVDRLGVGLDLLADNPFALIPVLGTLVLLVVVLRPPAAIARSFDGHDAWRDAVLVIMLGSIVAYVANDTGAAALGFGFGTALAGLLEVSLATTREMIAR